MKEGWRRETGEERGEDREEGEREQDRERGKKSITVKENEKVEKEKDKRKKSGRRGGWSLSCGQKPRRNAGRIKKEGERETGERNQNCKRKNRNANPPRKACGRSIDDTRRESLQQSGDRLPQQMTG